MKAPLDYRSSLLIGIGVGVTLGGSVFYSPATLPLYVLGILCTSAGVALGIYNTFAFKRHMAGPTIETELEPGEQILKVFPGGRRITKFSASLGKWCITNQRLIYEGSKPRAFGSEPDRLSFPLKNLVNVEIIKAGRLDRFLEASFTTKTAREHQTTPQKVQIVGRELEEFKGILQKQLL